MQVAKVLADYVDGEAAFREETAAEHPEDGRNARSARGLRDLAAYIRDLPTDDERLERIAEVHRVASYDEDVLFPGEAATLGQFRFRDPRESMDTALSRFVRAYEESAYDALQPDGLEEAARWLEDPSADPLHALAAVRYLDGQDLEEEAVAAARDAGWTWDRVAAVLGRTRQSVWQRHRASVSVR